MSETNGSTAADATNGANDEKKTETIKPSTIYEFTVKDLDGNDVSLEKYRGNVLIIVNLASSCGFTKRNYKELNELYTEFKDHGLRILGFPCNQFKQETGDCMVIKEFIKKNNVEWDVFEKVNVNGSSAHELWVWLKSKLPGFINSAIKWNFTKMLVNQEGIPTTRYSPTTNPLAMKTEIRKLLNLPEPKATPAAAATESAAAPEAAPAAVPAEAN